MRRLDKKILKGFIKLELELYNAHLTEKKHAPAFSNLERIHIVSQPYPVEHTLAHLRMLWFAIITLQPLEILVQMLYSLFSFKFSMLNIFPQGNTCGAKAITKGKMEIPNEIKQILDA